MDDIKTAIDAGKALALAEFTVINADAGEDIPLARIPGGAKLEVLERVMELRDQRAPFPRAVVGTATHSEIESFIAHVLRFKAEESAVFADNEAVKLTAIYDYHAAHDDPRWGRHRAVYACPLSAEWKAWTSRSGVVMGQDEFGVWIDDHLDDLASQDGYPPPAAVLDVARNLVVRSKGAFERKVNVTTGEATLVCKDEHESTSTKIPRAFLLGIPVFVGGAKYAVEARVRFSLSGGRPAFSYALYRADAILRTAFGEVRATVAKETVLPIFAGSPE